MGVCLCRLEGDIRAVAPTPTPTLALLAGGEIRRTRSTPGQLTQTHLAGYYDEVIVPLVIRVLHSTFWKSPGNMDARAVWMLRMLQSLRTKNEMWFSVIGAQFDNGECDFVPSLIVFGVDSLRGACCELRDFLYGNQAMHSPLPWRASPWYVRALEELLLALLDALEGARTMMAF